MNEVLLKLFMLLAIIPLFLSGCYTTAKNIENTAELSQAMSVESNSIVFGRIKWIEDGNVTKIGDGVFTMTLSPHLMKMEDKTKIIGEIQEEGFFVWSLKKGAYLMNRIRYRDPWTGEYYVVPKVAFSVPENGKIFYIGTLRGEIEPDRMKGFWLGDLGNVKFAIFDECNTDCITFQQKHDVDLREFEKSLMIIDQRLPRNIDNFEDYNLALSIMNIILQGISLSQ